jgi:hypothetical protein
VGPTSTVRPPSVADFFVSLVFVHGLRGHPRKTWESSHTVEKDSKHEKKERGKLLSILSFRSTKSRSRSRDRAEKETSEAGDSTSKGRKVFWPADLLPAVIPNSRILTYGYNADVVGGFFQANNKNSILQHGNDLMVKLERALNNNVSSVRSQHAARLVNTPSRNL